MTEKPSKGSGKAHIDGQAFLVAGTVLLGVIAILLLGRGCESLHASKSSSDVLVEVTEQIPVTNHEDTEIAWDDEQDERTMPTVCVGDYGYIGTLTLPTIDVEVPIASECDDARLRVSPCRYAGNYYLDDLVICGQGYSGHFGLIGSLGIRDEVRLLAVDGTLYRYVVSNVETDHLEDIDAIIDDWDLTLFTFNADDTCLVIRCIRTE